MEGLHPLMAPALRSAFLVLQPTIYLGTRERLYRPHVAELLGRVVEGKDLRDPTAAEMMGLMAETSLVAPMLASAAALYFRLFRELFPGEADSQEDDYPEKSSVTRGEYGRYPGDVEEMQETLRKRMRRDIEASVAGRGRP